MPLPEELQIIRQQRFAFLSRRWAQLNGLVGESTEKAMRFLTVTNAGGAVATLSFMGGSENVRAMIGPRVALCCFAIGIIVTGILIALQLHQIESLFTKYKHDSGEYLGGSMGWDTLCARDEERCAPKIINYVAGYTAFTLFIVGCIAGAISLFTVCS